MSQEERSGARAKVEGLRVKYKSATIDAFLDDAFDDLGAGGMFIRTDAPFPVTTLLKFEVEISSSEVALAGVGRVAWVRTKAQADENAPAGMGIKFIKVDDKSRQVIDAVVMRGSAGLDYVKGVRDSIHAAQLQEETAPSVSPPANPTIISVPPPASREPYRERNNTLLGIASPAYHASVPAGQTPAAVVVPTPSHFPAQHTPAPGDSAPPPSSFGTELATEIWRRPDSLIPAAPKPSEPPARIQTPSSLRPARLATPVPPPSSIPAMSRPPASARRSQPPFRTPTAPPPRSSGVLGALGWAVGLVALGGLGFWFGTRGSVEHVEPKADIIRPAVETPARTEGPESIVATTPTTERIVEAHSAADASVAPLAPVAAPAVLQAVPSLPARTAAAVATPEPSTEVVARKVALDAGAPQAEAPKAAVPAAMEPAAAPAPAEPKAPAPAEPKAPAPAEPKPAPELAPEPTKPAAPAPAAPKPTAEPGL